MAKVPQFIIKKAKEAQLHTTAEIKQAKERIPVEYHDFLLLLPQNVKLNDNKYELTLEAEELGVFSFDKGTYVSIEKPYMTADGRVCMAREQHLEAGAKLNIHPPVIQPFGDINLVSVTVESDILGSATGTIEVGKGGAVDSKNPFANAQTSAIGRALGFLGYGLVGTGVIATADEMAGFIEEPSTTTTTPSTELKSNAPQPFRCQVVEEVVFNRDGSSSAKVKLESQVVVSLVIPKQHVEFARTLKLNDVINVKGWLNNDRLRVANDVPQVELNQAG